MTINKEAVTFVLIAPLLLAVGCVNAGARSKSIGLNSPPVATPTSKQAEPSIADAADESADPLASEVVALEATADETSPYYDQPVDSPDLIAVDLETTGADETTELPAKWLQTPVRIAQSQVDISNKSADQLGSTESDAAGLDPNLVAESNQLADSELAQNQVAQTALELVGSSILDAPNDHLEQVGFVSNTTLPTLGDLIQSDSGSGISDPLPESSEVVQAGCRLFHENPPLRRECIDLGLGTVTSIIHPCGMRYLAPYICRVSQFDDSPINSDTLIQGSIDGSCPPTSWWEASVMSSVRPGATSIPLDIESLIVRTLANSKYLQGLSDLPLMRENSTMEAIAEFDTTGFMETKFRRPSDPVGNDLTVGPGGGTRFRENDYSSSAGIARKTSRGGRVQLAQEIGLLNNNSSFLNPKHQGNSRLTLNITQPLLSGSGKAYNTSLIMLAQMDERLAWDEVSEQLQDYLVEVTGAYWQLYLERSRLQQKEQHLHRAETILNELEQRQEIDAVANQIARARSAVHSRRSELVRARTQVRNVESRLRALVNDPQLYGSAIEVVPVEAPQCQPLNLSVRDAMSQALESRSEIDKAIQKVRAAGVRLSVAKNELLPVLDLVLESYLSGLQGRNDIAGAWVDQFSVGEPSYSAGIRYEIPIGNRLAKNRHQRRRVEMRQAISQFEFQVEELMSEVEIAVREVDTSYEEMLARSEAMIASQVDLNYFQKRWELVPGDNRSASFLLEDILEAQDRLAAAESNFAQTQVSYAVSIVNMKRALGILMQSERVETTRDCHCGLPRYEFHKDGSTIEPSLAAIPETGSVAPIIETDSSTDETVQLMPFDSELTDIQVAQPSDQTPSMNPVLLNADNAPVIESYELVPPGDQQ